MNTARPKNLNLLQIRLPVAALVSILHRVSGAILFLVVPLLIWALQESVSSPDSFIRLMSSLSYLPIKLIIIGLVWAYLHHFCAGIRHLILDMHFGTELAAARLTSKLVLGLSITLTVVIGVRLW